MNPVEQKFFVAGGTLPPNSPCYIERKADRDLVDSLASGEFCYVLDSRQKGKSSLMGRALVELRSKGIETIKIDLQRYGTNLDPERWYAGMLNTMGQELGLVNELFAYWKENQHLGPLQRWIGSLENVVLARFSQPVVVFVDEIDYVRSLPFRTDEFFAAIRECFNRRSDQALFNRLTFCLLGVATPSELIKDVKITPFNIGRRIELSDFTLEELEPFVQALSRSGRDGRMLLQRVLHWTGGHPYLTQKLALALYEDSAVVGRGGVDRLVEGMFFSNRAKHEDPNLADVSRRVLESEIEGVSAEEARSRVLDLYQKVREGKRSVQDDETDPVASVLKLSGLTRVLEGYLVIRNRIYFRAFDHRWVRAGMPDAEAQRQRAAARKAVLRTAMVAGTIILALAGLAGYAFNQRANAIRSESRAQKSAKLAAKNAVLAEQRAASEKKSKEEALDQTKRADANAKDAEKNAKEARRQADIASQNARKAERSEGMASVEAKRARAAETLAKKRADDAERLSYIANMNLVPAYYEKSEFGRIRKLLRKLHANRFRGLEWDYWNRLCNLELLTLSGNGNSVLSVAYSPDSKRIITGSDDGTAKIWDATTGKTLLTLNGHKSSESSNHMTMTRWNATTGKETVRYIGRQHNIQAVAFSPDGDRIVTGSGDFSAKVWDSHSGAEVVTLIGHEQGINSVVFSPNKKLIVSGSSDNTAIIWNAHTGKKIHRLIGHTERINTVAFSPDSKFIATGSDDESVRTWNALTGKEMSTFKGHLGRILSVAYSPDGNSILSGSRGNNVRIWDVSTGEGSMGPEGEIAAYSPDGKRIVTKSANNVVKFWDAESKFELYSLKGHNGNILSLAFAPDGKHIVTGSEDQTAMVWDARSGREPFELQGMVAGISPDGRYVASGSFDFLDEFSDQTIRQNMKSDDGKKLDDNIERGVVRIWDTWNGRPVHILKGHAGGITSIVYSLDGQRTVTGSIDCTARLWNANSGRLLLSLNGHSQAVRSVALSPDGKFIITGSDDKTAKIWSSNSGRLLYTLKGHQDSIQSVTYSPNGRSIVTGSSDRTSKVWDATTGKEILTLKGHKGGICSVAFSPNGREIVTGSEDHTAKVWSLATGHERMTLQLHTNWVRSVAYSPDGQRIATASYDGLLVLWDSHLGSEMLTVNGGLGSLLSVAFSPNSSYLVAGSMSDRLLLLFSNQTVHKMQYYNRY